MVLPQAFNNLPCAQCLILGGQQLDIKEVGVVIQEHDEVELSVWSMNGEGSAEVGMDQIQHMLSTWR